MVVFMITGLLLTACGGEQDKIYTVGVINLTSDLETTVEGFKQGMIELGYTESENIAYIYEGPAKDMDKLDPIAQSLVKEDVDLILSLTTPATQAAQRATANTAIPVVFVPVNDPVKAGLVNSIKQPGGNITGVLLGIQEARRLEWLLQVDPTIEQVYIPYNPQDRSATVSLETVKEAAPKFGIELITQEVTTADEVMAAAKNVPEEADAVFILPDSLVSGHSADFVHQLPTSGPNPELLERDGILSSYGIEQIATGKQAARLADQILRGVKPSDLPVETAEFFSAINLKTAKAIGLDIPDEILLQADTIVR